MNFSKKEIIKYLITTSATMIGFFGALYIHGIIDNYRDYKTFQAICRGIEVEANVNADILKQSIDPNIDGIIYRGYSIGTCESALSNATFLQNVDSNSLSVISDYKELLRRTNIFIDWRLKMMSDSVLKKISIKTLPDNLMDSMAIEGHKQIQIVKNIKY